MGMRKPHALLDQMIALRGKGLSMRAVGDALGVTKNVVVGALGRAGMCDPAANPVPRRPWEPEEEDELRRLAAAGVPDRDIAARLSRDVRAIKARLHMIRTGGADLPDRRTRTPTLRQAPPEGAPPSGPGQARQRVAPLPPGRGTPNSPAPSPSLAARGLFLPRGPIPAPRCCQWPVAMREGRPRHLFCEAPRAPHSPAYCAQHHACAYAQPKPISEAA